MAIAQNLGTAITLGDAAGLRHRGPPRFSQRLAGRRRDHLRDHTDRGVRRIPVSETYRFRSADLGVPGPQPVSMEEYNRLRDESIAEAKRDRAARREQAGAR